MTWTLARFAAALTPAVLACACPAAAQQIMAREPQPQIIAREPPPQAAAPAPQHQNPVCARLEGQLAAFDRGASDPARVEQIRRFEAAAAKQEGELERLQAISKKTGCEGNGFFLFGGQPAQCGGINKQIQQMRANFDRINADLAQLQSSNAAPERAAQRRTILVALAQSDCGPQYRQAAAPPPQRGGLFESLFGGPNRPSPNASIVAPEGDNSQLPASGTYRTVCVRMCDGYFYPISYSTSPNKFAEDERTCQSSCPATEVMLFSHRNPGEDINQAVSSSGQSYTSIPNAFRYRQAFDQSCSCKRSGESWAHALKGADDKSGPGDVPVNDERANPTSQPRVDAQGKPVKLEIPPRPAKPDAKSAAADTAEEAAPTPAPRDPNRPVRQVGPTFIAR